MTDRGFSEQAELSVDELVAAFTVRQGQDGRWTAMPPAWFGDRLFGGMLIGQAVAAAFAAQSPEHPPERRMHSLHAYFLRAGRAGEPVSFTVEPLKEGRTLSLYTVAAWQDERQLLSMTCSFAADTDGYEYQLPPVEVGDPPAVAVPDRWPGHIERMGPTPPERDGTMRSTARNWLRAAGRLPDDRALHASVIGYYSDITSTGGRPLHLEGNVDGLVSLDHAVWFHRPARADEWLLFDVHSLINAGGRGVLRGGLYTRDRTLVASVAQEMIIRPVG